ncbi:carbon storage regulator [Aquipseudomonas campi]
MTHLVLSRREGEALHLSIAPGANAERLLEHLRRDGITISVTDIRTNQVSIGINAPGEVLVLRDELVGGDL